MAGLLWLIVARVTHLYMRFKEDITSNYYEDMVEIKRFGKKSVTFGYEELAKHISEKKIYLQNGTIRIPYADGRFPIFTWDYGVPENDFFQFLRHKCSLSIPDMSAKEMDMVRKTRFGWGCFHGLTLPLLWISIGYCLAVSIAMNGFVGGFQEFGALYFSVQNLWGLGVLASLGLTVLVKLFNYVPLRIHFKDYDTVLRVKL